MKKFEIHDLTTNEILADNLSFDKIPELCKAYEDFYPDHEIAACYRYYNNAYKITKYKQNNFKAEWFVLVEENLCNFY